MPTAPLPYILMRVLYGDHARWIDESFVNYACQAYIVLMMYAALSRFYARPIPFLAAVTTIPIFLALRKTILYDALAQASVASLAVAALFAFFRRPTDQSRPPRAVLPSIPWIVCLAFISSLCVLSKQNTGVGASFGLLVSILFLPADSSFALRSRAAAIYAAACIVTFFALCFALSPFMDLRGLAVDAFLTGSEPKGGPGRLLSNLGSYSIEILELLAIFGAPILLILRLKQESWAGAGRALLSGEPTESSPSANAVSVTLALVAASLAIITFSFIYASEIASYFRPYVGDLFLSAGLALALVIAAFHLFRVPEKLRAENSPVAPLALLTCILFPAAILHNLSVENFRWEMDNNPIILVSLATLFFFIYRWIAPREKPAPVKTFLSSALVFIIMLTLLAGFGVQVKAAYNCTESWPEVGHLQGARLRENANGMRSLIERVRALAPDAEADEVLLLPGDPNVEAWFERPRPALSSSIIFADQYWDRYVDADFSRLEANPPKVIVIGPRGRWRQFHHGWQVDRGAERLIDRIQDELIPDRYRHEAEHAIIYQDIGEIMDVYVLEGQHSDTP